MRILAPQLIYGALRERFGLGRQGPAVEEPAPIERTGFNQRLENHLSDVKRGEGWRSRTVNHELREKHHQNMEGLAQFDPSALQRYMGMLSGMPYPHQARLASVMNGVTSTLDTLQRAPEEAQQMVDELRAIYAPDED